MAARDFSVIEKRVLGHLRAVGATVDHHWVSPDRNIFVVRYSAHGHDGVLAVSHVAADVLDHWDGSDVEGFLQGYRVVEAVGDLGHGLAFWVTTSDGPAGTFKGTGVVIVEEPMGNLGLS